MREELLGEWLQPSLTGHGGTGAPLRTEGQIDVFNYRQTTCLLDPGVQFIGEHALVLERLQDRVATFLEIRQLCKAVADGGDSDLVEAAGLLFAVAGDEGDGAAVIEQSGGGGYPGSRDVEFGGNNGNKTILQSSLQDPGSRNLTLETQQSLRPPPIDEGLHVEQILATRDIGVEQAREQVGAQAEAVAPVDDEQGVMPLKGSGQR